MNESKKTKKALRLSVLATFICIVMLIGTTFAWFTDTAGTGVNRIQSGNLKIKLEYKNKDAKEFQTADAQTAIFDENALWEPGHVEYAVLKLSNAGSLALKYKLGINIASENGSTNVNGSEFNLSDYIRFAVVDEDQSNLGRSELLDAAGTGEPLTAGYASGEGHLAAGDSDQSSRTVTLVVWMPSTVGNEANHAPDADTPSIDLGINVVATQDTVEYDSFGNEYDKNATYPVTSQNELDDALNNAKPGSTIVIPENVSVKLDNDSTLNEGITLSGTGIGETVLTADKASVGNDDITIRDMTIKGQTPAGNDGSLKIGGTNTTLDNVNFIGQGFNGDTKAISVTGENFTIKNSRISNAFRGIIFWDNIGGNNLIENCTIDNVIYTFNINATTVKPNTTLTVRNSVLNGWTSYSECMKKVSFDNCNLGESNGYAYLVAYADSEFSNCTFNDGYQVAAGSAGKTLIFKNCKLADGTQITAGNFADKLGDVDADMKACTVIIDGVTVNWN